MITSRHSKYCSTSIEVSIALKLKPAGSSLSEAVGIYQLGFQHNALPARIETLSTKTFTKVSIFSIP